MLIALLLACGLGPPAVLTGTVRSTDGAPVSGAHLVLRQGDQTDTATSDARGAFTFRDAALPVILEVSARGFAPIRRLVAASPAEFVLEPASVTASVVVSAERLSEWRDPETGATVLAAADLDVLPAVTPDEALRVVSGFSLFRRSSSRSANPTTDGVTMRGLSASGSSRALILLDGTPLNDGFGGWVTWTRLPPAAMARVDIQRGAAGDAFGSDALGGVIRIVTPRGETPSLVVGGDVGSPGVDGLDLSAGGHHQGVSTFVATSWFRTDGSIPLAPESRGAVDRPANAEWANAFGRVDVTAAGRWLTLSGWGGRDDRGNGTVLQLNRMRGGTFSASFDALGSATTFAARVSVSPNRFYQTFTTVAPSRATETLTSTQSIDTTTTRAIVEFGGNLPRGHALVGATVTREAASFDDARPSSTTTQSLRDDSEALSAQVGFTPAARVSLDGGLRHEWRAAPTSAHPLEGATVGHVSGVWQLAGSVHLRGSASTSHRWPTLNELVRNFQVGNVLTLANPALTPERAVSLDGAVTLERPRWQASVGAFHTILDHALANVTLPSGSVKGFAGIVRQRENAGEAHVTGAELDAEVRPLGTFRVRASATLISARFLHSVEPRLEGLTLPQVPHVSFSLDAQARLPRTIDLSVVWHDVSSQFDDDRNLFLLAGASQVDLRVAGRLHHIGWYIVVENATDARIEVGRTPLLTLAPPRAVRVGVNWGW
jgi:outer membrane receptor protein involved in Fe transport